jgi:phage baseplate assembly protein W
MAGKRFLGTQYPLINTPLGLLAQKTGVDQIKANLLQLLLTNPGERVMNPDFGTPLRKLLFEPNDPSLAIQAKHIIAKSIQIWEPRIEITGIEVTSNFNSSDLNLYDTGEDREAILGIKISFVDPKNINQIEALVLQLPIGG